MSTELPPTPDWQTAQLAECQVCGHSAPPTCQLCGGVYGLPGIPRCQRCIGRGPTPTIEATEPRQLPPVDPAVQRIIDNSGFYDDTV